MRVFLIAIGVLVFAPSAEANKAMILKMKIATKSAKAAKKADSLIRNRKGYARTKSRKKLKAACKDVHERLVSHLEAYAFGLRQYQTALRGGRLMRGFAIDVRRMAAIDLGAARNLMPVHIRCFAAKKRVRVYLQVSWRGQKLTLTAKRWTRRDRIRIRRALKSHVSKMKISEVQMVDESGAVKGTHRF